MTYLDTGIVTWLWVSDDDDDDDDLVKSETMKDQEDSTEKTVTDCKEHIIGHFTGLWLRACACPSACPSVRLSACLPYWLSCFYKDGTNYLMLIPQLDP